MKIKKVFVISAVSLILVLGIAYFSILYLQSSYLKTQIIPKTISYIEANYPVKLSIGNIRVKFFEGLLIENLKADAESNGLKFGISVERVQVRYSLLSLLGRRLKINLVSVTNLIANAKGELQTEPSPPAAVSPIQSLKNLSTTLRQLPFEIDLSTIRIEPIALDLDLKKAAQSFKIKLNQMTFDGGASVDRNGIELRLNTNIPKDQSSVHLSLSSGVPPVSFVPGVDFKSDIRLLRDENSEIGWTLKIKKFGANLALEKLIAAKFTHPVSLNASLEAEYFDRNGRVSGEFDFNGKPICQQRADWTGGKSGFDFKTSGAVSASRELAESIPAAEMLRKTGDLALKNSFNLKLNKNLDELIMDILTSRESFPIQTSFSFEITPDVKIEKLQIDKNLSGMGLINLTSKALATYSTEVNLPAIKFDQINFGGAKLINEGHIDFGDSLNIEHKIQFVLANLTTGYESQLPVPLFETGANLLGEIAYSNQNGLKIRKFSFFNTSKNISFEVSGATSPGMKNINLEGDVRLSGGGKGAQSSGEISLPWKFIRTAGGTLNFQSQFKSHDFSITGPDFSIKKLTSSIPIGVELNWKGGKDISLSYVLTRNPFERVDYADIRPYVSDSHTNLKIESLRFKNYEVGPLYANASIHQNLLVAEEYQMNLFDGAVTGHLFLDLGDKSKRVGFLGRLVGLDPKAIQGKKPEPSDKRLSSRVAVICDFEKSMAEGRLDITEIGGPQLIELINVLDPEFKDSKLNLARSLLKVAHPKYVGIQMSQGFMDLGVDMGGLISLSDLGVRGVPLTPVLSIVKATVLEKLQAKKIQKGNP
ncbi:MAG: exported protein of unknown function [Bacteriovoracaceae bacterium]|nr:exported protein of unknown function [Bacteriovoracaceae bacterium]